MRVFLTSVVALALPAAVAAQTYSDSATSQWFKSLSTIYEGNCCDQSDCHIAKSDFRDGSWWALSNRTGHWVKIVTVQLTMTRSIFRDGVLCEGDPIAVGDGYLARVYCFSPPPLGF